MKVILLQNVSKLGQKGEIKKVSEGYALNFLLPRKLAKFVSGSESKQLEKNLKNIKDREEEHQNKIKSVLKGIANSKIVLKEKTNNKGSLFAQVHHGEIIEAISRQLGVNIEKDWIKLNDPIKEVGEFDINIEAYKKKITIKLFIESK